MAHIGFVSTSVLESKDGVSAHVAKIVVLRREMQPFFPPNPPPRPPNLAESLRDRPATRAAVLLEVQQRNLCTEAARHIYRYVYRQAPQDLPKRKTALASPRTLHTRMNISHDNPP